MAIEITSRSLAGMPDKTASHKEIERLPPAATEKRISRSLRLAPRLMRRNFSSRAPELSGGKAIILSVPKSGRTWIRTFLNA
jgi:transcription termination factor Rho